MRAAERPTTVVLSPPPTPNGPLHVGHLSGPYLAADVAVRAARRHGTPVLSVCGLDDHQNYVVSAARAAGLPVDQVRNRNAERIRGVFQQALIRHDLFIEPLVDAGYRAAVARLLAELTEAGTFPVRSWTQPACSACGGTLHHAYLTGSCFRCGGPSGGGTCEGCGAFVTAATLLEPRCTRCGGPATGSQTISGPVLPLAEHRQALLEVWARAQLPPRIRRLIEDTLADGLPQVPLSYPTDWGIPSLGERGHRIDVWAEMALGYLYAIGTRFDPAAADLAGYLAGWQSVEQLWAFLGIDNGFYYAIMFPAMLLAAGIDAGTIGGLVVNEFYRLDGQKFSTSRQHAIWADELLDEAGPELVRLFLCWDRPGSFASDFTRERFRQVIADWPDGPAAAANADLARAEQALSLPHFAPDLAARCLLSSAAGGQSNRPTAAALLSLLTGRD